MAKREIGTVIKIDGEAQFKSALSNINQELRVLSSEMGASMSAFDKNSTSMEALKTKSEMYGKEIDAQKSKLEVLEQAIAAAREAQEKAAEAVRKATEEHGENSKEAKRAADEYDKVTKKLNGYEIQANNTTRNINQLTAASKDNNAEMEKLNLEKFISSNSKFESSLENVNNKLKLLSSEIGASVSAFDKNSTSMETLKAKGEQYGKELDIQREKLDILNKALAAEEENRKKAAKAVQDATVKYGENSTEAQQAAQILTTVNNKLNDYKIQANNTTRNINQLTAASKDNNAEMEKLKNAGIDKLFTGIKDGAKKAASGIADMVENIAKLSAKVAVGAIEGYAKAIGAVGTAAAGAAVELGKEVVTAYADYEQLVGGVDTLFGESSQKLQDYAANAYKTAGMNANDYMETVTGFSASLIQSLGGDTEKAVDYASMAITDMSDNANKMGTDISSIQTTYQGFAKQNYTMLDNLKLGYGGTKEEMQRLLDDASAISGIEYDVSSYADIVSAIHVIQENMDIAGATAAEAESTISGSISAMQSAAQNLVVGLGNDGADIQNLCDNFTSAFGNVISNIEPVIQRLAEALPSAAGALLGAVGELLPQFSEMVMSILPELTAAVVNIAGSLVQTITGQIPELIETVLPVAIESFNECIAGVIAVIPELVPTVIEGAVTLFQGMLDGLNNVIAELTPMLPEMVDDVNEILVENIPELIDGAVQFFTGIVNALTEATPSIMQAVAELIPVICDTVIENIPLIIDSGIQLFVALADGMPDIIVQLVAVVPQIVQSLVSAVTENTYVLAEAGVKLFVALVEALPEIIKGIVDCIPAIVNGIKEGFENYFGDMSDIGKNIISGIGDGIIKGVTSIKDKINSAGEKIMQSFKDFFGIASPSKLMKEQIGFNLADGVAIGFTDQMGKNSGKMAAAVPKDYSIGIVIADEKSAKKAIDTITADYKKSRLTAEQADTALLEVYKTCEQQKISIAAYANEKITAARKEAADEDMKTLTKAIETEIKAYEKQMQDIEKEIQSTANSLSESYKSMYTFETDEDGNIISAKTTDKMKNATAELENYYAELEKLSGRNISETMVKQLSEMSVEEGTAVAAYWNTLSDEKLNAVSKNWEKYQDTALKVSEWFHADEIEQAASDMINAMSTTISENGEALDEIGIQLVEGIKDGMTGKKANSSIREMCDNFVKQFKDYFGIASPSKLMKEQIGFNLADGVSGGFVDRMKRVSADMNAAVPTSFGLDVELKRPRQNEALSGVYGGRALNFTQINNSPKALDAATINRQTRQGLQLANCMR